MCADTDLAWAAGFFEAEGTVTAKRKNGNVYLRLAVSQNGGDEARQMLERFVRAVEWGAVLGPYDYSYSSLGKKPRWVVQVQSHEGVVKVMEQLRPFLTRESPKLAKYEALLQEKEGAP